MKCSINVVLPIPGSPTTHTIWRLPVHARSQSLRSRESASVRPMNDRGSRERSCGTTAATGGTATIALVGAMKRYLAAIRPEARLGASSRAPSAVDDPRSHTSPDELVPQPDRARVVCAGRAAALARTARQRAWARQRPAFRRAAGARWLRRARTDRSVRVPGSSQPTVACGRFVQALEPSGFLKVSGDATRWPMGCMTAARFGRKRPTTHHFSTKRPQRRK